MLCLHYTGTFHISALVSPLSMLYDAFRKTSYKSPQSLSAVSYTTSVYSQRRRKYLCKPSLTECCKLCCRAISCRCCCLFSFVNGRVVCDVSINNKEDNNIPYEARLHACAGLCCCTVLCVCVPLCCQETLDVFSAVQCSAARRCKTYKLRNQGEVFKHSSVFMRALQQLLCE